MDIPQLRSFLAVADALHFRRAAAQVHLSQPALSAHVQALERDLGVRLFTRDRQKTTLTYAGGVFRDDVRELLGQLDGAVERARHAETGVTGRLRVGFASTALTAFLLPPLTSRFRQAHPATALAFQNLPTSALGGMLESGALDVAFLREPIALPAGIEAFTVHREPLVALLPAAHPLARVRGLELGGLAGAPFILYSRRSAPGYHDLVLKLLNDAGFSPMVAQEAGEMYTLAALVSAGVGVAIAPISTRAYHLPGVVVRQIPSLPAIALALGYRAGEARPFCRAFIELARAASRRRRLSPAVISAEPKAGEA